MFFKFINKCQKEILRCTPHSSYVYDFFCPNPVWVSILYMASHFVSEHICNCLSQWVYWTNLLDLIFSIVTPFGTFGKVTSLSSNLFGKNTYVPLPIPRSIPSMSSYTLALALAFANSSSILSASA